MKQMTNQESLPGSCDCSAKYICTNLALQIPYRGSRMGPGPLFENQRQKPQARSTSCSLVQPTIEQNAARCDEMTGPYAPRYILTGVGQVNVGQVNRGQWRPLDQISQTSPS